MARRLTAKHDEMTRMKIQTSQLVNRLMGHANGEIDMTATQVKAAEILLRKCIPDLAAVQHTGEVQHTYVVRAPSPAAQPVEWQTQHAPRLN